MDSTKYGKYIIKEPLYKGKYTGGLPMLHICAEEGCYGSTLPNFPAELTVDYITEPVTMSPKPHAHDYDQVLCFIGGNPRNFYRFGAEVEISLGEEEEKHIIDKTAILYIPKGLIHCPLVFRKVEEPILFMHITFASVYRRITEDSDHPSHSNRKKFSQEEIFKLRGKD